MPYQESGAAIPHIQKHHICSLALSWAIRVFILPLSGFLKHVVLVSCETHAHFLINNLCVYRMLVTFHAIWYVITELSRPAWQKELRDITFYFMEEAKKDDSVVKIIRP